MTTVPPPQHLSDAAAEAWEQVVTAAGATIGPADAPLLEEYAQAIATARAARDRVNAEGLIVADARGEAIPHPALTVEAKALDTIRRLAPHFAPKAHRAAGYMYRATNKALAAAPDVSGNERYAGAVAATRTLAWIIDMAQEDGREAMRRAAFGPIPTYLKAIKDLGLSPTLRAIEDAPDSNAPDAAVTSLDSWVAGRGA